MNTTIISQGYNTQTIIGWWSPNGKQAISGDKTPEEALFYINKPLFIVLKEGSYTAVTGGTGIIGVLEPQSNAFPIIAYIPECPLENLGDKEFCRVHNIRYPYVAGSMAHGISSPELLKELAKVGMLGFYGTAGLTLAEIEAVIDRLEGDLGEKAYGFNLIHTPNEPYLEKSLVDLYLRRGVRLVEASAYLDLTLPLVRYCVNGIHTNSRGDIIIPNRIIAKVSRIEVASKFFSPPPDEMLLQLLKSGEITEEQFRLAQKIPIAQDITAEADSGGHTDNRPAITLLPTILAIRDQMQSKYNFSQKLRVGIGGGISTPESAAAVFSMGASYIVTGSINQACIESGTSNTVREMLAQTKQADITMAPCADMFEMGVKVQVLKRSTMFPMRSLKLYNCYNTYERFEDIPLQERSMIEKNILCASFEEIWNKTCKYFEERDNTQILLAEKNPRHKMALVFKWYISQSSRWAVSGDLSRKIDYQIWCGPSMGAFNEWVKNSFLEKLENRKVTTVALNILFGAAVKLRQNFLKYRGDLNFISGFKYNPLPEETINKYLK